MVVRHPYPPSFKQNYTILSKFIHFYKDYLYSKILKKKEYIYIYINKVFARIIPLLFIFSMNIQVYLYARLFFK